MQQQQQLSKRKVRDCDQLYMCRETYHCATAKYCLACAYKIAAFDLVQDIAFTSQVHNVRPESCPRFHNQSLENSSLPSTRWVGFTSGMNILTIGDGDFSFSRALKTKLLQLHLDNYNYVDSTLSHLVATSLEPYHVLSQIYPNVMDTLQELKKSTTSEIVMKDQPSTLHVSVRMQVDATQLQYTLFQSNHDDESKLLDSTTASSLPLLSIPSSYHRIIWNFPCLAMPQGQDGQNEEMEMNKNLIRQFITSIVTTNLLKDDQGEIHLTHKTKPPFDQWNLVDQVLSAQQQVDPSQRKVQLEYKGRIVFDKCLYPLYIPRKALNRKSFSYHDACIFIFAVAKSYTTKEAGLDSYTLSTLDPGVPNKEEEGGDILPVTPERIERIRQIHLMVATKRAYDAAEQGHHPIRSKRKSSGIPKEGKKPKRHK